jgi:hypothetical protein
MRKRKTTKLIHEGHYIAEVDIELLSDEEGWTPYISLDDVRKALKRGDIAYARSFAKIYTLKEITK